MTERTITPITRGPIALVLELAAGTIRIDSGPHIGTARVVVKAAAESGPSADAVRDATVERINRHLEVRIASDAGDFGSVVMSGNGIRVSGGNGMTVVQSGGSTHISGGGRVFVNGVEVGATGDRGSAPSPIEVWAYLPAGSSAKVKTKVADTYTSGHIDQLDFTASFGNLSAASVGDLDASVSSGSVRVADVTGSLFVNASSGSIRVSRYSGSGGAVVSASSGSIDVAATPQSSGRLKASASSGSIRLAGTAHLKVSHHVSSGSVRIS